MVYKRKDLDDVDDDLEFSVGRVGQRQASQTVGHSKLTIVILLLVIILGGGWILQSNLRQLPFFGGHQIYGGGWYAIFLSNNQVYFGQVKNATADTLTLRDIYYLQVVTTPLQRTQEGTSTDAEQNKQELKLIKLGNELHDPVDEMVINQQQILLTEKLRDDSRVVKAILSYQKNK